MCILLLIFNYSFSSDRAEFSNKPDCGIISPKERKLCDVSVIYICLAYITVLWFSYYVFFFFPGSVTVVLCL